MEEIGEAGPAFRGAHVATPNRYEEGGLSAIDTAGRGQYHSGTGLER